MKLTKSLVKKGGKKSLKKTLKMKKSKKGGKKGSKKSLNTKKARKTRKMKAGNLFSSTAYDCSGKGNPEVTSYDKDGKSQQERLNDMVTKKAEAEGKVPVVEENMVLKHQEGNYDRSSQYYVKGFPPAFTDKEKEDRRMLCYIPDDQDAFKKMKGGMEQGKKR